MDNVLLLGFGAAGATFASQFSDAGFPLQILCDEKRKERYAAIPTLVNDSEYTFSFVTADEVALPPDVILVAVKAYHLRSVLETLQAVVAPHTTVLSLLNGIDSEAILGEALGAEKILPAFITHMDSTKEGPNLRFTSPARIVFGELDGRRTERVERLERLFERAGVRALAVDDVRHRMWAKFMFNVGINQVGALLGAPYGTFQDCPEAREALLAAMREVPPLAARNGVDLSEKDIDLALEMLDTLAPEGNNSMVQDREAGIKTEVDLFAGEVCRLGERYDIATPVNRLVFQLIRALEWQERRRDTGETLLGSPSEEA